MAYYVYILTNQNNTVLYIGVTNNLERRYAEHTQKQNDGFTKRYNVQFLVYYEEYSNVKEALLRETSIKNLVRRKKDELINSANPEWNDLSEIIEYTISILSFWSVAIESPYCHSGAQR